MGFIKYPSAVKALAVRWRLEGKKTSLIRRRLGRTMHDRSITRWTALYYLTRAVIRDPESYEIRGRKRKLGATQRDFIRSLVEGSPHLFLSEIRSQLYAAHGEVVSLSTVQLELQSRLLITLKKAGVGDHRKNLVRKAQWIEKMFRVPANFLVFTDESGIVDAELMRIRQRSKKNHRTTRVVPKHSGTRYSLLPAIAFGGLLAMRVMKGSVNRRRFEGFLKYHLLPRMNSYPGPNSVLVLDNAAIHHRGRIAAMARRKGIQIVYLPTYSPELNPIELGFGIIKMRLRHSQALLRRRDPVEVITTAAEQVFDHNLVRKLYYKCGYHLPADRV